MGCHGGSPHDCSTALKLIRAGTVSLPKKLLPTDWEWKKHLKDFQDLILAKDLGYGDTLQLMSQFEEVSPSAVGLEAYTTSILASDLIETYRIR